MVEGLWDVSVNPFGVMDMFTHLTDEHFHYFEWGNLTGSFKYMQLIVRQF